MKFFLFSFLIFAATSSMIGMKATKQEIDIYIKRSKEITQIEGMPETIRWNYDDAFFNKLRGSLAPNTKAQWLDAHQYMQEHDDEASYVLERYYKLVMIRTFSRNNNLPNNAKVIAEALEREKKSIAADLNELTYIATGNSERAPLTQIEWQTTWANVIKKLENAYPRLQPGVIIMPSLFDIKTIERK